MRACVANAVHGLSRVRVFVVARWAAPSHTTFRTINIELKENARAHHDVLSVHKRARGVRFATAKTTRGASLRYRERARAHIYHNINCVGVCVCERADVRADVRACTGA